MARIVILEHELQRGLGLPYMLHAFADRWRALGHDVTWHFGTTDPPDADLAILHVDLTVVPQDYRDLLKRYRRIVNGPVVDISKSRFSAHKLAPSDDWSGPVIVKTDANFFGRPERLLSARAQQEGRYCDITPGPTLAQYPIYRSPRDVPDDVWRTPGLIVEKFLPERDDKSLFCVRVWTFLGQRETCSLWRSAQPIIKATNTIERGSATVPEQIRTWRQRLGFDFGKFDFVIHEGQPVLLDVNRSPSFPRTIGGTAARTIDIVSPGIEDLLAPASFSRDPSGA